MKFTAEIAENAELIKESLKRAGKGSAISASSAVRKNCKIFSALSAPSAVRYSAVKNVTKKRIK